ncbi:hypothetical protein BJX64DRAFT_291056 [Aspergillus heterothallicus]
MPWLTSNGEEICLGPPGEAEVDLVGLARAIEDLCSIYVAGISYGLQKLPLPSSSCALSRQIEKLLPDTCSTCAIVCSHDAHLVVGRPNIVGETHPKAAKANKPAGTEWHHVFSQEADLATFFKQMGINIHKVGKCVPVKLHDAIHNPLPGKWELGWNDEWRRWIMEQTKNGNWTNLTQRDVMRQMHKMMEKYGISQFEWTGRDWHNGVATFLLPRGTL